MEFEKELCFLRGFLFCCARLFFLTFFTVFFLLALLLHAAIVPLSLSSLNTSCRSETLTCISKYEYMFGLVLNDLHEGCFKWEGEYLNPYLC